MDKYAYIILGAGPSGLSIAHSLIKSGCPRKDILVIEKEPEAGGLCRSKIIDGAPLDIGGGHFLDVRNTEVLNFIFDFMPRVEWMQYERVAKIRLHNQEIDHPLEANLWQFPVDVQIKYLESIAQAGCIQGTPMPETFAAWIRWKLGGCIADDYMLPYNRKIWSTDLDELGVYWLYKLPDVSFPQTLESCLKGKSIGKLPAHGQFLYPKHCGYGEVWRRMGEALGASLILDCPVEKIDFKNRIINDRWYAKIIISTIPWTLWAKYCELPDDVKSAISKLKNAAIGISYCRDTINNDAHWIYEPNESISYHRILLRHNFCKNAQGYWTETNSKRLNDREILCHYNEYAYPINTLEKLDAVERITAWARQYCILAAGRWGKWEHMNSDVAVAEGMTLAKQLYMGLKQ